jgi:hypothetical protein
MLEEKKEEVKDLATEAAILSLTPAPEEVPPRKDQNKSYTKRWLETLSDCT